MRERLECLVEDVLVSIYMLGKMCGALEKKPHIKLTDINDNFNQTRGTNFNLSLFFVKYVT